MQSLHDNRSPSLSLPRLAWRHKGKMLLAFSLVIGLTMAYFALAERSYQSEAKILVRLGRETVGLDPTASTGAMVTYGGVQDARESETNTVEELLASRAVAERVVDQFGPDVILDGGSSASEDEGIASFSVRDILSPLEPYNLNPLRVYSKRDKAIKSFGNNLGIATGKKLSVISISYEAEDPAHARDVLTAVLDIAREEHLRMNRTEGSQEFFNQQVELLKNELAKQEIQFRDMKNSTGLASLDLQRQIHLNRIGTLEDDLVRAQAERDAVEAEVSSRRQQLANLPAMIVTEQTTGQPETPQNSMRTRLYELEIKEQDLASKLLDSSPLLTQTRNQLAEARRIVAEEKMTTEIKRGLNQAHQAVELALQEREAQLVALTARTKSLESKVASAKEALKQINENEVKMAEMERGLDLARVSYRKYADNLEQARIDEQLHRAKISSLNLMQPPTYSETPSSPNPKLTLGLGLVAGIVASFGVALLADRRRHGPRPPIVTELLESPPEAPAALRPRRTDHAPANPR